MEKILFLGHTEADKGLSKASLEALAVTKQVSSELGECGFDAGLVGAQNDVAANQIAGSGVGRVFEVCDERVAIPRYASDAAAAEAICRQSEATIIVAAGTSRWSRVLAGVAYRLGGRIDTHVCGISSDQGALSVTRWFYRQRMRGVYSRVQRPWILLVDPGTFTAWSGDSGSVETVKVAAAMDGVDEKTKFSGIQEPPSAEQTIRPDAELLFVAGAGWTKKQADGASHTDQAEKHILGFLRNTKASLGGSKSIVEQSGEGQAILSFMTHLNQIGQTGATPRHPKGLATCCHGEEPHVVGWRFINERRAVNLDPNCGWAHGKADVLYVADAFAVMEKVNAILSEAE